MTFSAQKIIALDFEQAIQSVKDFFLQLQQDICHCIEQEDGSTTFMQDPWQHTELGGGLTAILQQGKVIEKAGVNFSHVQGKHLPHAATLKRPELKDAEFQALGVSTVIHPHNPYVPTAHMNVRLIVVTHKNQEVSWWFGGGFDLTPYYPFTEDCLHWHQTAKNICDPFGPDVYFNFKKYCDEYFFLKHRQEARGIGGIFFDDLNTWDFDTCFNFIRSVGKGFMRAYQPILAQRKILSFGKREKDFQNYRRGRYVEFNLLHDRGTLFGLQSNGRVESILMSLPPLAAWQYNLHFPDGSPEATLKKFLTAQEWIAHEK